MVNLYKNASKKTVKVAKTIFKYANSLTKTQNNYKIITDTKIYEIHKSFVRKILSKMGETI